MNDIFYKKYLKYKNKYLNLQNKLNGGNGDNGDNIISYGDNIDTDVKELNRIYREKLEKKDLEKKDIETYERKIKQRRDDDREERIREEKLEEKLEAQREAEKEADRNSSKIKIYTNPNPGRPPNQDLQLLDEFGNSLQENINTEIKKKINRKLI